MSTSRDDFGIAIRSALLQRGAKQKFSLIFYFLFGIIIFFIDSYPSNFMIGLRSILNDGIYTTSKLASSPFRFFESMEEKTKKHFFLIKENKILKEKLIILEKMNFDNKYLSTENMILKEVLDEGNISTTSSVIAKVLLDKSSPYLKSIIINKGRKSNIGKGMAVVDGNHLVGRVIEVNYFSSRVLLLNDLNSKIPVMVTPSGTQALLSGNGTKMPVLEYMPEINKVTSGKQVFTSGKDGIFTQGIAVGETRVQSGSVFDVTVKLFSDPSQLSFVRVINTSEGKKFDDQ